MPDPSLSRTAEVMRGLLFGMGAGWALLAVLFLFDLFVVERG